jgi:hypothetical protein
VSIAEASAPERGREDEDGKEKEDACDFEPQNAADAPKGLEKSTYTACQAGAGFAGTLRNR